MLRRLMILIGRIERYVVTLVSLGDLWSTDIVDLYSTCSVR